MPTNKTTDGSPLAIATLDKALHDHCGFCCGFAPADNLLKSSLSEQVRDGMATAWLAAAEGDKAVVGFNTVGAMAVRSNLGPSISQHARVPDVSVIYIRAVAVHEAIQVNRLGTALEILCRSRLPVSAGPRQSDPCLYFHGRCEGDVGATLGHEWSSADGGRCSSSSPETCDSIRASRAPFLRRGRSAKKSFYPVILFGTGR